MNVFTSGFKALSDLTRLRALRMILVSGGDVCVCELADSLQLPQYQVSKHLAILKQAGLVEDARVGTWVYYSIPSNLSKFASGLCSLVVGSVVGASFEADAERLQARLRTRANGRCVVGPTGSVSERRVNSVS